MSNSNPLLWRKPPMRWSLGIAVVSVAAALLISRLQSFHLQSAPVSLFLCAVMISAWFGELWPGLLAIVLSCLAFSYYFLEPLYSFAVNVDEIPRAVLFLLSALFVGSLTAAQRSATESLMSARDKLRGAVQELEKANEALQAESEERKEAEKKLQESEAYLAEAQKLSHTGTWARVAGTGEVRYWSEECYRVMGFEPHSGPAQFETFLERVHPDDRVRVREIVERALREKIDYELDYRIVHPDGNIRNIHTVGHPVLSPSGDIVEFVGTVMDVTERKRAEEALRRSEAYLAEAQRLSHTGSWAWIPATGEIRYFSEECYRVLGFDPRDEQPRYETFFPHIHPDDQAKFREKVDAAAREKVGYELDYRIVHPAGDNRDIHVVGHPVLSPSGDLVEFVGTVIDVTERKRAEEERERLRRALEDLAHMNRVNMMGELTASLAHEVNQPIAAAITDAKTCIRWLTRDHPDLEEAREAASRTVQDATRAAEIINRIRLLFKKSAPQWESVDVNEVVLEMTALLRDEATRHSVFLQTKLAPGLPKVKGDRIQLQQVMMNLMINSIDAMKDVATTRELSIQSQRAEDEQLVVSVSDTGVGLPPQQADKIFDPFFTTKLDGTGMGLRISRSIIESHGGRLWAADRSPRGASFYFTLPTIIEAYV